MAILHKNISAEGDIHNPKWFSGANNGDVAWRNELGVLESTDELVLPAALNFVDGSVAPPTSNSGDIYVLSSGASVNAGWGTVALGDWVRYDGTTWNVITPQKSSLCYNEASDSLMSYTGLVWAGIGGGISSVTSAEKAALSPSVGEFVYDTDLSSLQRYNGSVWVSVANGYGLVEVLRDSDNGIPKYFTDLQTALDTCKTSGSVNTVNLKSNITLSSQINITTSSGFNFSEITLNGNGFKITFDDTGSDTSISCNVTGTGKKINFLNLTVERLNGTGTHYSISVKSPNLKMSNCYFYSNNGGAGNIQDSINQMHSLGGSVFESDSSISTLTFRNFNQYFKNFTTINNSSGNALENYSDGNITEFMAENTSTGKAIKMVGVSTVITNFNAKSNSGVCIDGNTAKIIDNFYAQSNTGLVLSSDVGSNFYVKTGNATAIQSTLGYFYNGYAENNSSSPTIDLNTAIDFNNITAKNYGAGYAFKLANTISKENNIVNVVAISIGGVAGFLDTIAVDVVNCSFISEWNNVGGHALRIDQNGNKISNCYFRVKNSSANSLFSSGLESCYLVNSTFDISTTPINANVTVTATTDLGNGNRQI